MSEALERRAVACPGWRWVDGARGFASGHWFRVVLIDLRHPSCPGGNTVIHWAGEVNSVCYSLAGRDDILAAALPDLADRATIGCLADLTRAHLAALTDRDAAHFHGLRVAAAWQDWLMGRPDRRAVVMVETLETLTLPAVEVTK